LNGGYYPFDSPYIAGTIETLNNLFCISYTINQIDNNASLPGILYGRYQGDSYAGGNPW
jgi:glucoamylase